MSNSQSTAAPGVFVAEIDDSEPRPGEALAILRGHPPTISAPYGKPGEASRVISTEGNRTERTTVSPSASHECTMSGPKIT